MFGLSFRRSDPELPQDLFWYLTQISWENAGILSGNRTLFMGCMAFFRQAGGLVVGHLLPLVLGTSLFPTSA